MAESAVDMRGMLIRLGGDSDLMDELLDIFLEVSPHIVQRLERAAVIAYDSRESLNIAHELKGTAANIGAEELRRQAALYEMTVRQGLPQQAMEHFRLILAEYERVCAELRAYRHPGVV